MSQITERIFCECGVFVEARTHESVEAMRRDQDERAPEPCPQRASGRAGHWGGTFRYRTSAGAAEAFEAWSGWDRDDLTKAVEAS